MAASVFGYTPQFFREGQRFQRNLAHERDAGRIGPRRRDVGQVDAVRELLTTMRTASRQEPGCRQYDMFSAETDGRPTVILTRLEQGDLGQDVVGRLARARLFAVDPTPDVERIPLYATYKGASTNSAID